MVLLNDDAELMNAELHVHVYSVLIALETKKMSYTVSLMGCLFLPNSGKH